MSSVLRALYTSIPADILPISFYVLRGVGDVLPYLFKMVFIFYKCNQIIGFT